MLVTHVWIQGNRNDAIFDAFYFYLTRLLFYTIHLFFPFKIKILGLMVIPLDIAFPSGKWKIKRHSTETSREDTRLSLSINIHHKTSAQTLMEIVAHVHRGLNFTDHASPENNSVGFLLVFYCKSRSNFTDGVPIKKLCQWLK